MKTFILILILNFQHSGHDKMSEIEQIHGIPTLKECFSFGKSIIKKTQHQTFVCIPEIRITNLQRIIDPIKLNEK